METENKTLQSFVKARFGLKPKFSFKLINFYYRHYKGSV